MDEKKLKDVLEVIDGLATEMVDLSDSARTNYSYAFSHFKDLFGLYKVHPDSKLFNGIDDFCSEKLTVDERGAAFKKWVEHLRMHEFEFAQSLNRATEKMKTLVAMEKSLFNHMCTYLGLIEEVEPERAYRFTLDFYSRLFLQRHKDRLEETKKGLDEKKK